MMEDVLDLIDVKDRKIEILESEAEELENDVLTLRAHGREMDDLMEEE